MNVGPSPKREHEGEHGVVRDKMIVSALAEVTDRVLFPAGRRFEPKHVLRSFLNEYNKSRKQVNWYE